MSFEVDIKVDKKGFLNLQAQLKVLGELGIDVGWFDTRYGPNNENLTHAQVAAWQEVGRDATSMSGPIPPRPFFRVGYANFLKSDAAKSSFAEVINSVVRGDNALQALSKEGAYLTKQLQKIMDAWDSPPNARLTIQLKGFNDPLVNTHELIDKATFKVRK